MSRPRLMIPGPVDVFDQPLEAVSQPVMAHYGKDWVSTYWEVIDLLQQVLKTRNRVILMPASGSGAIDTVFGSMLCTGEKMLVVDNGSFSGLFRNIAKGYGIEVEFVSFPWGKPADPEGVRVYLSEHRDIRLVSVVANESSTGVVNPVRDLAEVVHEFDIPVFVDGVSAVGGFDLPVDEYGIDLCATVANKALEGLAGVGIISVSDRAWNVIEGRKNERHHGWYTNLSVWRWYQEHPDWRNRHPQPVTQPTGVIRALRASLRHILFEETLPVHFARCARARDIVRAGLRNLGFSMLADDGCASPTVTAVLSRPGTSGDEFLRYMAEERNTQLGWMPGEYYGHGFRLGTMGRGRTDEYLRDFLLGVEAFLRSKGIDVPEGAGLVGFGAGAEAATR